MIIDDEIQYLGSNLSPTIPHRYAQRTVSGIALHIEKSDSNDAYVLVFNKDKSSTVHVGRRPGTEIESRALEQEKGKAMFRCAVVSRRHAKIAFSDSGNVYLIDLGSHHGTHVRKPGETSSRALEHEVPTPLSDGDIITFGKSVGRNEEMVRPIVARVELRYSGPSTTPIKPLVVPDISPSTGNKSHSGRYGLHSPSSSSDDVYSVDSDLYSDIEEIPPPAPARSVPVSQPESQPKATESHFGRAIEVLKRLLPPTSIPSVPAIPTPPPPQHNVSSSSSRLEEQSPIHSISPSPPASITSVPSDLPPFWSIQANHSSPFSLLPRYPSISSIDFPDDFFDLPPFNPPPLPNNEDMHSNDNDDNNSSRERSESPMDLASPSPPPPEQVMINALAGVWNDHLSSSSSFSSRSESDPIATPKDDIESENSRAAEGSSSSAQQQQQQQPEGSREAEQDSMNNTSLPFPSVSPPTPKPEKEKEQEKGKAAQEKEKKQEEVIESSPKSVTPAQYEELKAKYTKLQSELQTLQSQRRKYKAKFNANVHTVTGKFHEVEEKLLDMNAQYSSITDQIDGVEREDIPELQAQIDDLKDQKDMERSDFDELRKRLTDVEDRVNDFDLEQAKVIGLDREVEIKVRETLEEAKDEVQDYVDMLQDLTDEMSALRTKTEQAVKAELETLRELRASILEEVASFKSLKRKRSVDDQDLCDIKGDEHVVPHITTEEEEAQAMSSDPCSIDLRIHQQQQPDRPSPRKRARKFASVAAQTVTAVTMGAVVTWVALAFS